MSSEGEISNYSARAVLGSLHSSSVIRHKIGRPDLLDGESLPFQRVILAGGDN